MDEIMEKRITEETMKEYEFIRSSGASNMFDYYEVIRIAGIVKASALAALSSEDYMYLLMNFGRLMKKFDVKQD